MNEVNNNINVPEQNTVNVQEPVNMVNNVNNQPPKKSKKGLVLVIILSLVIVGLCAFIYLKKDVLFNNGNNSANNSTNESTNVNENNNIEEKEEELTDPNLKKSITDKANMIVMPSFIDHYYIIGDYDGNKYFDDLYKELKLSDKNKLLLILEKQKGSDINVNVEKSSNMTIKELYNQNTWSSDYDRDTTMRQYNLSSINSDYKYLFGTSISSYEDIKSCPSYFYDSVNNVYISYSACGGLSSDHIVTYLNRLTQKNNDIYVYVSVGRFALEDEMVSNSKLILYSDYEGKNKLQELSEYKYTIDSSNYDKFSEYKLTFTKDGNDYYYKSIERTK